jgi:hypothetical protein
MNCNPNCNWAPTVTGSIRVSSGRRSRRRPFVVGRHRRAHAGAGMLAVVTPVGACTPLASRIVEVAGRDVAREIRLNARLPDRQGGHLDATPNQVICAWHDVRICMSGSCRPEYLCASVYAATSGHGSRFSLAVGVERVPADYERHKNAHCPHVQRS